MSAIEVPRSAATDVIPKTIVDAKGDLIVATAADIVARLAVGTDGRPLVADSTAAGGVAYLQQEMAYVEITGDVTVNATVEGTPTTVVSAGAVAFDGATRVCIEFYCPRMNMGATAGSWCVFNLWDNDATDLGRMAAFSLASLVTQVHTMRYFTPAAATKTYKIKAWRINSDATVDVGAGGAGTEMPGFVRISRAPQ
jgi:hypothetical protein